MTVWPDAKTAEEHLIDLKRVRGRVTGNEYRVKVIDDLIRNTEAEAKAKNKEVTHFQ